MIKNTEKCKLALAFARKKHQGQMRHGGEEYITHPMAVAEILYKKDLPDEYVLAALFHDLLEDTDATEEEISALGGEDVLLAVKLLTKEKGYSMSDYIEGIKKNPLAREVKAADRLHNLICARESREDFRLRYLKDSIDWYLDLSPEIPVAAEALRQTLTSTEALSEEYLTKLKKYLKNN